MNVQLPKEYKVRKRDIVIYTICIIICVVALTIVVTMQVLGEGITNKVFHTNKLQIASEEEQLKLLATNGMLVKRPLVVNGDTVLIGFKEAEWAEKLN